MRIWNTAIFFYSRLSLWLLFAGCRLLFAKRYVFKADSHQLGVSCVLQAGEAESEGAFARSPVFCSIARKLRERQTHWPRKCHCGCKWRFSSHHTWWVDVLNCHCLEGNPEDDNFVKIDVPFVKRYKRLRTTPFTSGREFEDAGPDIKVPGPQSMKRGWLSQGAEFFQLSRVWNFYFWRLQTKLTLYFMNWINGKDESFRVARSIRLKLSVHTYYKDFQPWSKTLFWGYITSEVFFLLNCLRYSLLGPFYSCFLKIEIIVKGTNHAIAEQVSIRFCHLSW